MSKASKWARDIGSIEAKRPIFETTIARKIARVCVLGDVEFLVNHLVSEHAGALARWILDTFEEKENT